MRIQHQYKMHGYSRDRLGNALPANNPHPFHVGIRFPDMNIQVVSVAKLRRKYRPCDRYSRRSLSGQKGFAADNPFRQYSEIRSLINA